MTEMTHITMIGGLGAMALYVLRLNELLAGRHVWSCIAAQVCGVLAGGWIMGSTALLPAWAQWLNAGALVVLIGHLVATAAAWEHGAPAEAETMPGALGDVEVRR